jgi:DNA-binding GntR family transcriptional regulator
MPRKDRAVMEQAYEAIKCRIVSLDLRPGQRLDDYQLAAELKISRTPVREAIFLLAAEGLVVIRSTAGFVVRSMDFLEISSLLEAHMVLSKAVARLAAQRVTPESLRAMRAAALAVEQAIDRREYLDITQANARLHRLEGVAAHNDYFRRMVDTIQDQSQRLAYLCFGGDPEHRSGLAQHFDRVVADHQAMLAALEARDPEAAEATAVAHVRLFRTRIQSFLASCSTDTFTISDADLAAVALTGDGPPRANGSGRRGRRVAVPRTASA